MHIANPCIRFLGALWGVYCYGGQSELIRSDAAKTSPSEAREFLDKICPGQTVAMGCSVCPAETAFPGDAAWQIETIIFGHFLGIDGQDALVSGSGCESHANGLRGAYLFTKDRSSWLRVWYDSRENTNDCKRLTASDGRDLLACWADDIHQGLADSFLYLVDAGQDPDQLPDTWDIFFDVDDTLGGCVKMPDGATVTGKIDSVAFVPAPKPPEVRITVSTRVGKAVIPDHLLEGCGAGDPALLPTIDTVSLQYKFVFNGQKIVPEPGNPPMEYSTAIAPVTSYHEAKQK